MLLEQPKFLIAALAQSKPCRREHLPTHVVGAAQWPGARAWKAYLLLKVGSRVIGSVWQQMAQHTGAVISRGYLLVQAGATPHVGQQMKWGRKEMVSKEDLPISVVVAVCLLHFGTYFRVLARYIDLVLSSLSSNAEGGFLVAHTVASA